MYVPGDDDDDFDGERAEEEATDGGEEDNFGGDFIDRFGVVPNEKGSEEDGGAVWSKASREDTLSNGSTVETRLFDRNCTKGVREVPFG
ncbi:hypothetical protein Syun_014718 [Stephania yunnanensis]|uniref:Uncharacterized protein n=1 Tax=Stephania yunnanensis TaxID=152371 RepID=A0AAP0JJV2_9MAGN